MKTFPTLYKKNNEGKIEQWKITVFSDVETNKTSCGYFVYYGEHKGKLQKKSVLVKEGKNQGKKNQTNKLQQAFKDAEGKFNKKLKSGYVTSLKAAKAGKLDKVIKGGIVPMLAHPYEKYKNKIKFPVYVQPKLDGERCIAIKKNGTVTLWTRSRKPIHSCPHIVEQLKTCLVGFGDCIVDGELYSHTLRDDFESLMKAVRKQKPSEESKLVEFHIFDMICEKNDPMWRRIELIEKLPWYLEGIEIVETYVCADEEALEELHKRFMRDGYEGTMIKDQFASYENKRSKNLLKYKNFQDAEFQIVGCEKGEDSAVVFVCETKNKVVFRATMSGDKKKNQVYLKARSLWAGKKLTVKFQGLTGKNKVPRFPVGLRIRNDL